MRRWQSVLAVCVLGACIVGTRADDQKKKDYKDLIVATWVPPTGTANGVSIDFTDDGKVTATVPQRGGKTATLHGTYELDGKKLKITWTENGKQRKEAFRISKLTDKELRVVDQRGLSHRYKHE
jgi:uncharacterized protein (TIGR03066 family)